MKRIDIFSFSLALIINLIIIILLTSLSPREVDGKIKVGLVSMENKKNTNYEGFKETEGEKINPKPEKETEKVEDRNEKNISQSMDERLKNLQITPPKLETASKNSIPIPREIKDPVGTKETKDKLKEKELKTQGKVQGVPSGYKIGTIDGDMSARWNPKNREPEYPIEVQNRGIGGLIELRLTLDEAGNIRRVIFNRGTGVPEIDLAIEKIARTWKINLTKNGKPASGEVILEYNFKLVGE